MVALQKIRTLNPWLDNKEFSYPEEQYGRRFMYNDIIHALDLNLIISISGLRRVGKTTLLRQLSACVRQKNAEVFYYQFDEQDTNLEDTLSYYFETLSPVPPVEVQNTYIFLDELQYVEKWQDTLKYYYDLNRKIQFIVTGSTTLYLHKDTKESLAGRIMDFSLDTLSFDEYVWLKNGKKTQTKTNFLLPGKDLHESFMERHKELSLYKNEIYSYLIQGEFPETIVYTDYPFIKKYFLSSVLDKIISKDIDLFQVTKSEDFYALYRAVLQNTAQVVSVNNISTELGIARQTVDKYLQVMEKAFLVELVHNYRRSVRAQETAMDKAFTRSVNLLCAVLHIRDVREIVYPDFAGHVIETYVFNQIKKQNETIDGVYYLNKDRKEIDFIIHAGERLIPAEVKMKNRIAKTEVNRIANFLESHNQEFGIIYYSGDPQVLSVPGGRRIYCTDWV